MKLWQKVLREEVVERHEQFADVEETAGMTLRQMATFVETVAAEVAPKLRAEGWVGPNDVLELNVVQRTAELAQELSLLAAGLRVEATYPDEPLIFEAMQRHAHLCPMVAKAIAAAGEAAPSEHHVPNGLGERLAPTKADS